MKCQMLKVTSLPVSLIFVKGLGVCTKVEFYLLIKIILSKDSWLLSLTKDKVAPPCFC